MRALGIFNVCYGLLGLISTLLLVYVMPTNPLPREAVVAGGLASTWIIVTGVALIVWGRRAKDFVLSLLKAVRSKAAAYVKGK